MIRNEERNVGQYLKGQHLSEQYRKQQQIEEIQAPDGTTLSNQEISDLRNQANANHASRRVQLGNMMKDQLRGSVKAKL